MAQVTDGARFLALGPMEVRAEGCSVAIGGARQRAVLATLLVEANRVVSVDRLISAVWDDRPPSTARHQIRMAVSALRRSFAAAGMDPDRIATRTPGYLIHADAHELDAREFEVGAASARACAASGNEEGAAAEARQALQLWRGEPWDGILVQLVRAESIRLCERRLSLLEDCLRWELDLGQHHELVGELVSLTEAYPLRERYHYLFMLALYRDGRQADALEAYRRARAAFRQELGLDPGEELQRLQQAILQHDASLALASDVAMRAVAAHGTRDHPPRQLPRDVRDFCARENEIRQIVDIIAAQPAERTAVATVAVAGPAGVGKSALGVKAGHTVASSFPGGQLYADLGGTTAHPEEPSAVLARFLRALGVSAAAVPDSIDERAELYRSRLAGTRTLVVLDNVVCSAQVSVLLPGDPSCAALVTGRAQLSDLPGVHLIHLDVLEHARAVRLLESMVAAERAAAEPEALARIAVLCGGLPLALRIAGARLAARPHWRIARLADLLADDRRRLDELVHGDLSVRASIGDSYAKLAEPARVLLRRIGMLEARRLTAWEAAALLNTGTEEATETVDQLVDAQLLAASWTSSDDDVRYHCHPLVRTFAQERARAEESVAELNRAQRRLALGAAESLRRPPLPAA